MDNTINTKAFGKNDIRGIFPTEVNSEIFFCAAKGYVQFALNELKIDQSYDVSFSFQNGTIYGDNFKSTWYHNKVQSESLQIHIDDRDNKGIFNISYDYQVDKSTFSLINPMIVLASFSLVIRVNSFSNSSCVTK